MAKTKKTPAKAAKPIADVAHPGTSAPSDTSKPIITPRPIMKDPMVVEEGIDKSVETAKKPLAKKTSEVKIIPPGDDEAATESDPEPEAEPDTKGDKLEIKEDDTKNEERNKTDNTNKPDDKSTDEPEEDDDKSEATSKKTKQSDADAEEAAVQEVQDANLQKLVDSKKYFLPINAVEHRRTARFVALGIILALLLAIVWVDVALDAGLIHMGNVKPVTHFFSN